MELARELVALRVGARLRGVEVTADGSLERLGPELRLRLGGSAEKVRLGRLTAKVQLDTRKGLPRPASREESLAWERLRREERPGAGQLRITGPLVRANPDSELVLEVREYWWFSPVRPPALLVSVGLDVNGPYGLAEPWAVIRDGLNGSGQWKWMAEAPDLETATFRARTADGLSPSLPALARRVSDLGAGATLRGVEVVVEGWLTRQDDRPHLRAAGSEGSIGLAPLNRPVQKDERHGREASKTGGEAAAYETLLANAGSPPRLVRVFGPLVESRSGPEWLLEVRGFELDAGKGDPAALLTRARDGVDRATAATSGRDRSPPAPPGSLSVEYRDGQIRLSWDESPEKDVDAYNVFRSTTPGKGYIQIAAGIVRNRCVFRVEETGVVYHYVITARDLSGNESGHSAEATVSIPKP